MINLFKNFFNYNIFNKYIATKGRYLFSLICFHNTLNYFNNKKQYGLICFFYKSSQQLSLKTIYSFIYKTFKI